MAIIVVTIIVVIVIIVVIMPIIVQSRLTFFQYFGSEVVISGFYCRDVEYCKLMLEDVPTSHRILGLHGIARKFRWKS